MAQPLDRPTKPRVPNTSQAKPPARTPPGAAKPPAATPPGAAKPPAVTPPGASSPPPPGAPKPPTTIGTPMPPRNDRSRLTSFLLGVLLGMTVMLATGTILWGFGILPIIEIYTDQGACPQSAPFLPMCPTCAAACPETAVPHGAGGDTPTPTGTATPVFDLQATATAACSVFQSQFPGTPCP